MVKPGKTKATTSRRARSRSSASRLKDGQRREVCFLIGRGGALLWSDASSSAMLLPDSRARWEAIWEHRDELEEIAHSHPHGPLAFSGEDKTTLVAITSALGKKLTFSVIAPRGMIRRQENQEVRVLHEPWWAELLRLASGMERESSHGDPEHHL